MARIRIIHDLILGRYNQWIAHLHDSLKRQQAERQRADFEAWYEKEIKAILQGTPSPS